MSVVGVADGADGVRDPFGFQVLGGPHGVASTLAADVVVGDELVPGDGVSFVVADTAADLNITQLFIRPRCPWQKGKVERFNRRLQVEWAYRQVFDSNNARTAALAPWLEHYNHHRRHTALGGKPPISCVSPT